MAFAGAWWGGKTIGQRFHDRFFLIDGEQNGLLEGDIVGQDFGDMSEGFFDLDGAASLPPDIGAKIRDCTHNGYRYI